MGWTVGVGEIGKLVKHELTFQSNIRIELS